MDHVKESYYFSHDSNARSDPKIMALINLYGMEGYGRWWVVVEMLREQTDYKLKHCQWLTNAIAMAMLCDANSAEKFISDCINEFELLESDGEYFWSNSLLRRMEIKEMKRQQKVEAGRKGAEKRWSDGTAIATPKQRHGTAKAEPKQSDGTVVAKNGKGKESKRKEKSTPPTPPQAIGNDDNGDPDLKKINDTFSSNIHLITPIEAETLAQWLDDGMSAEVIIWAIRQAVLHNKRNARYINAILSNLHKDGITTLAGAEARERDREQKQQQGGGKPDNKPIELWTDEERRAAGI